MNDACHLFHRFVAQQRTIFAHIISMMHVFWQDTTGVASIEIFLISSWFGWLEETLQWNNVICLIGSFPLRLRLGDAQIYLIGERGPQGLILCGGASRVFEGLHRDRIWLQLDRLVARLLVFSFLIAKMSLKVPKANNIQLFKDGYKVTLAHIPLVNSDANGTALSNFQGLKMHFFATSRPYLNCLTLPAPVLGQMVFVTSIHVCVYLNENLGRNKLVINHLGRLFVTSDAATIIREIEVVHPAAKLLVMASQAQEAEVSCSSLQCAPHSLSC